MDGWVLLQGNKPINCFRKLKNWASGTKITLSSIVSTLSFYDWTSIVTTLRFYENKGKLFDLVAELKQQILERVDSIQPEVTTDTATTDAATSGPETMGEEIKSDSGASSTSPMRKLVLSFILHVNRLWFGNRKIGLPFPSSRQRDRLQNLWLLPDLSIGSRPLHRPLGKVGPMHALAVACASVPMAHADSNLHFVTKVYIYWWSVDQGSS